MERSSSRATSRLDLPDLPDGTVTVAHGGQTGLKVIQAPNLAYPQFI